MRANKGGTLAHTEQAKSALLAFTRFRVGNIQVHLCRIKPMSIVGNANLQTFGHVVEMNAGLGRARMPPHIRQGFLHDAEDSDFSFWLRGHRNRGAGTGKRARNTARRRAIAEPLNGRTQAEIIENRGAQVAASPAHAFKSRIGQVLQTCDPLDIFLWQRMLIHCLSHTLKTQREGDQRLRCVVMQLARQAAPFLFLYARNERSIILQFTLTATRTAQILQRLLQFTAAQSKPRTDQSKIVDGEEWNQEKEPG